MGVERGGRRVVPDVVDDAGGAEDDDHGDHDADEAHPLDAPGQGHEAGADDRDDGDRAQEGVVEDAEDGVAEVVEHIGRGDLRGEE